MLMLCVWTFKTNQYKTGPNPDRLVLVAENTESGEDFLKKISHKRLEAHSLNQRSLSKLSRLLRVSVFIFIGTTTIAFIGLLTNLNSNSLMTSKPLEIDPSEDESFGTSFGTTEFGEDFGSTEKGVE